MKRVTIIVNSRAGPNKFNRTIPDLLNKLQNFFNEPSIHQTSNEGDAGRIAISHVQDTDILIVAGGDETVAEVINAISPLHSRPVLAILPLGKLNDIAGSLNIAEDPDEAIQQIIKGETRLIDLGFDGRRYFLNLLEIGSVSFQNETHANGIRSLKRLPYNVKTNANTSNSFHYECSSLHHCFSGRADLILVVNRPFTKGFSKLIPSIQSQDGLLDIIIIREGRLNAFLFLIRQELPINTAANDNLFHFQTDYITLKTSPHYVANESEKRSANSRLQIKICTKQLQLVVGRHTGLKVVDEGILNL